MEYPKNSPPMEALATVRNYFRSSGIAVPDVIEQYFCKPKPQSGGLVRTVCNCFGKSISNDMDIISKNPGLQHISEDIFNLLDTQTLMNCRLVNNSWKKFVHQPMLYLKMLKSENTDVPDAEAVDSDDTDVEGEEDDDDVYKSWKSLAKELDDDQVEQEFVVVLMKMRMNGKPKYPLKVAYQLLKSEKFPELAKFLLEHEDISRIYNVPNPYCENVLSGGVNSIHLSAYFGLTETVMKLADKYDSLMIETEDGDNPIHLAAWKGHVETVKILIQFTDTPNAPTADGETPIYIAALEGYLDVVKFLVDLSMQLYELVCLH